MTLLLDFIQTYHGVCDQLYADSEALLLDERVDEGMEHMKTFKKQMER